MDAIKVHHHRIPRHPHRWTVGRAVSHGCVRLYNENIRSLYGM